MIRLLSQPIWREERASLAQDLKKMLRMCAAYQHLLHSFSDSFLIRPRSTCPGVALPTAGRAIPHPSVTNLRAQSCSQANEGSSSTVSGWQKTSYVHASYLHPLWFLILSKYFVPLLLILILFPFVIREKWTPSRVILCIFLIWEAKVFPMKLRWAVPCQHSRRQLERNNLLAKFKIVIMRDVKNQYHNFCWSP